MGNCQAIDAAALVIQHPSGRIERFYWPVTASEVMRMNPGHYVSLIIPLPQTEEEDDRNNHHQEPKTVRFTRVKLLRQTDTLSLGHAYRLVTTQEVMKVLRAKRGAKSKKLQPESKELPELPSEKQRSDHYIENTHQKIFQATKQERARGRATSTNGAAMARSKSWQPSLQSISEWSQTP